MQDERRTIHEESRLRSVLPRYRFPCGVIARQRFTVSRDRVSADSLYGGPTLPGIRLVIPSTAIGGIGGRSDRKMPGTRSIYRSLIVVERIGNGRLGRTWCKRPRAASGTVPALWGPFIHIGSLPKIAIRPLDGNLSCINTRPSPPPPPSP